MVSGYVRTKQVDGYERLELGGDQGHDVVSGGKVDVGKDSIPYYGCFECDLYTHISSGDYPWEYNFFVDIVQLVLSITHCDITIDNDVALNIHCDVTMSNDIVMCTYYAITMHTFLVPQTGEISLHTQSERRHTEQHFKIN